ncbi:hypothetical protein DICPUDRAFT_76261 [Dictyostelium purpureum]|uniref:Uncharacterized protein n=1 Tax=Dictyostelium purpureum TaxID=5786 RepID=F0ZD33_DICPU|nr:uncharacterized protein DICPUDRAFT_76261 [Dictyostelium purpureum]EGC38130.1 hypothetical protein DICPUDRAFT_76261 [Dictyostelium purpureum]|eukprot:XP_003285344.1 hypothetical protein DICPUDRAFT_76261 [Dictyostelium purpureum]
MDLYYLRIIQFIQPNCNGLILLQKKEKLERYLGFNFNKKGIQTRPNNRKKSSSICIIPILWLEKESEYKKKCKNAWAQLLPTPRKKDIEKPEKQIKPLYNSSVKLKEIYRDLMDKKHKNQ